MSLRPRTRCGWSLLRQKWHQAVRGRRWFLSSPPIAASWVAVVLNLQRPTVGTPPPTETSKPGVTGTPSMSSSPPESSPPPSHEPPEELASAGPCASAWLLSPPQQPVPPHRCAHPADLPSRGDRGSVCLRLRLPSKAWLWGAPSRTRTASSPHGCRALLAGMRVGTRWTWMLRSRSCARSRVAGLTCSVRWQGGPWASEATRGSRCGPERHLRPLC
jgi:hypothetical protein